MVFKTIQISYALSHEQDLLPSSGHAHNFLILVTEHDCSAGIQLT
jgi:hypothetical protein